MSNKALDKGFAKKVHSNINLVKNTEFDPGTLEEIWGKDASSYQHEIFHLGTVLFILSILVTLSSPLIANLDWSISTVQGLGFSVFVGGLIVTLKAFWVKRP